MQIEREGVVGLQRKRGVGVEVRRVEREGCTCGFGKGQAEGGARVCGGEELFGDSAQ